VTAERQAIFKILLCRADLDLNCQGVVHSREDGAPRIWATRILPERLLSRS
jgi:hypothetical protein